MLGGGVGQRLFPVSAEVSERVMFWLKAQPLVNKLPAVMEAVVDSKRVLVARSLPLVEMTLVRTELRTGIVAEEVKEASEAPAMMILGVERPGPLVVMPVQSA